MLYPDFNELLALKAVLSNFSISSKRAVLSANAGDYHSPFRGHGLEFDEVREYAIGDDIRNIDWRVTARTNKPHIKIFKEERERSVLICVDVNETMRFGTRGTFKSIQAARVAALVGWKASGNNDRVGGCLFGDVAGGMQFFTPKRSRKSLWAMLKLLSEPVSTHNKVKLEDTIIHLSKAVQTGALVYIISDFMEITQGLDKQLNRLKQRCDIVLISVNDPADQKISPIETILFKSGNNDKLYVNTDSKSGRDNYKKQWEDNRKMLDKITSRLNIPVVSITTNGDVKRDLLYGLRFISRRRGA
jgi:uncharacterized protein (DUF58 family)